MSRTVPLSHSLITVFHKYIRDLFLGVQQLPLIQRLQDLIQAAVNEALRKNEEAKAATMNRMAPGMGGMGGLF